MNALASYEITGPENALVECAQFTIDDTGSPFILSDIMQIDTRYTFSFWIKGNAESSIQACGENFSVKSDWQKHSVVFEAASENLAISFLNTGVYYIYHPKLENGNMATDWSPAPEDTEEDILDVSDATEKAQETADDAKQMIVDAKSTIQQLADSISALVRGENGGSLVRQDENGLWYFDITGLEKNISKTANDLGELDGIVRDANGEIDVLKSTAAALQARTEYVRSYTDENGQPCLELGDNNPGNNTVDKGNFKVRITNTEIQFDEDGNVPAKINRKMLVIEKAMIKAELQFGDDEEVDGVWIWKRRQNGNLGLSWKED